MPALLIAALAGLAHSRAFAHDGAWWLQLAALAVLAWLVGSATPKRAAALGVTFGTTWLVASTWWMYISLHDFGGLPAPLAALAVGLLCAALSLYLALAMAWAAHRRRRGAVADALLFAAVWMLAELARAAIFTGFPWAASGYAHTSGPLAPLAPWIGVYGMGFVAAAIASLVARSVPLLRRRAGTDEAARRGRGLPLARAGAGPAFGALLIAGLLLGAAWFAGPRSFGASAGSITATLIQTNVAQDEKFSLERMPEALDWLSHTLLSARGDLVVAPETAIPLLPSQLSPDYLEPLLARYRTPGRAALVGLPLGNDRDGYTNSVAGISTASQAEPLGFYRYDKHHLVPFGEFIPTGFRWFVDMMNIPLGDFNRGPLAAPSFDVGAQRVAPNICYEDLFGEELATRFRDAATAPTMFVNVSNIAWFGNTVALHQHEEISRMRTLEFQRPMLRSTNTGMTVVIDHEGITRASLAPYTRSVLEAVVEGRTGLTPFAWWSARGGLWPLCLLAVIIAFWPRRRSAADAL